MFLQLTLALYSSRVHQAAFRAMKGRKLYQKMLLRRFIRDQDERRLGAKRRKCVRMIEGAWMVRVLCMAADELVP